MTTPAMKFGVQSYCFRHFKDNSEVARLTRRIGVERIELCGVHADFHNLKRFRDVVKTYHDTGVSIASIGVQTFTGEANERDWFECASEAGASHISCHFRIDSYLDAIPKVQALCDEFSIKCGIHCHGGYAFSGPRDVIEHLVKLGSPQIGVCIDTAWAMQTGPNHGNPVDWVRRFKDKVTGVHYKDFVFDRNAQWHDVVVGTGNLDLKAFVSALNDVGFAGSAVIEYEADVENPVPALTECVKKMRQIAGDAAS